MPPRSTPGKKMVWQTMMPNRPFIPGQPISARSLNKVAAEAGRRLTVSSPLEITHDGMSTNIRLRTWFLPQWFEIVEDLDPSTETTFDYGTGTQGTVQDDVISCVCRRVRLKRDTSKYVQLPQDPQETLVRVYFPRIPHFARDFIHPDGPLKRIQAQWNADTGRWESDHEPDWIWVEAGDTASDVLSVGATGVFDDVAQSYNDVDDDVLSGEFRYVLYDYQNNTFQIAPDSPENYIRVHFPNLPLWQDYVFSQPGECRRVRAGFNKLTGRWESDYTPSGTYFAKVVNGPISAANCAGGTYTLGKGEAHIHRVNNSDQLVPVFEQDGTTPVIKDNVYQHSGDAIPENAYIQIERTAECIYKVSTVLCQEVCNE